ncbi:MAG: TrbI/VirB10 family protein, partial [Aquificaceae bacterium]
RVVSKQGQALARMLLAGFIEGISRIFQQSGTTVIVSPTGGTTTQTIDPSMALRTGLAGGMASATKELVEFYKKLAEETYPVVEINAGRNVDLVFLQSIDFSSESRQAQTIREEEQGILRVNRPQQEGQ